MRIPRSIADIDPLWINTALRDQPTFPDKKISNFSYRVVGRDTGFMGEVIILTLTYQSGSTQHAADRHSVVLKLPTQTGNRGIGETLGVYEREIRFYSELQPELIARTPKPYLTEMDLGDDPDKTLGLLNFINRFPVSVIWWLVRLAQKIPVKKRNYALLLEDLSKFRLGNQLEGCNLQDAKTALAGMAQLHAQYWNQPITEKFSWVIPLKLGAKAGQAVFLDCLPRYIKSNQDTLTPRHLKLLYWLKEHALALFDIYTSLPSTLLHGDFRLDNLFFDDARHEIVICDWQTLMYGPAGLDLAYFLSASLGKDSDENDAAELIQFYKAKLATHGIEVDQETLEWSYHAGMLIILHKVIPAEYQNMLELTGERGHQLAITWIERILQKLETVDLEQILHPPGKAKLP